MKIALITDTHFGARNDNPIFADYFAMFYRDCFFPYLERQGISTVIHLGDIVDRRKYINFVTARRLRRDFIDPCVNNGIKLHVIIGNHDIYYKNTNEVNAMEELYSDRYSDVLFHSGPTVEYFDDLPIAFLPWICTDNYERSMEFLKTTNAQVLFGHLELAGFEMYKGSVNDHGFDAKIFSKFDVVCTGHFHHKSTRDNINYLGAPYEITWSDYNDPRGFHIFDTETRTLEFIENPFKIFHKIHYDDLNKSMDEVVAIDPSQYKNTIVKVIVRNKTNPFWFDMVIEKLERAGVLDMQVVEDHFYLNLEDDQDIVNEAEDTITILNKFVDQMELNVDKKKLELLMQSLYNEALTIE